MTRVVPVPTTISPEAQKMLARVVSDTEAPQKLEERRMGTDKWQAGAGEASKELYPVNVSRDTIAGVSVRVVMPLSISQEKRDRVLINLHGGGFNSDSGSLTESIPIANLTGTKVIAVLYRLAPEHPFPAGLDDAVAVYKELLKTYKATNIGIYGTSGVARPLPQEVGGREMMTHTLDPQLLERAIRILVVGSGGNGSAIASGLPYLHQALLAFGHPGGLAVTLIDPDTVSETNCVRQPFCRTEIGLPKAIVLAHRINLFWGMNWQGMQAQIQQIAKNAEVDLVIGCVDTRKARRAIDKWVLNSRVLCWLDLGNNAFSGQFVLGQPKNSANRTRKDRLPTVAELYPEILKRSQKEDDQPSCSAAEALTRQEPFINQNLAYLALGMLAQLLRHGSVSYQGGFCNLPMGQLAPLPISGARRNC